ncbi:hypothetical protein HNQ80_001778 [Anaerosolibacter carboniphilus]|uniref:Uncharacterized protein n=1 Tax=Anaerosolibacter carboniphilus TaxID=1417629 RepID=A0A841KZX0_9FIRM|nr:hypothetical protein [Anaerosolibacter carboniphilus]MBB6215689.1 hypothetical protein [Anaerosolibacter carboniphilus]
MIDTNHHLSTYIRGIEFINQEIQFLRDRIHVVYDKDMIKDIYDSISILREFKKDFFKELSKR